MPKRYLGGKFMAVRLNGKQISPKMVLVAGINPGWNNSMGTYYPSVYITQFIDGQLVHESISLPEHHNPASLERELSYDVSNKQTFEYEMFKKERADAEERVIIRPGKTVRVVRGRKVPVGTEGRVSKMGTSTYGAWVLIETVQGAKHLISTRNVEVISQTDTVEVA